MLLLVYCDSINGAEGLGDWRGVRVDAQKERASECHETCDGSAIISLSLRSTPMNYVNQNISSFSLF